MFLSSSAVRMMLRPMRPKPLMPTLMGITSSDGVSEIAALQERMTAAGEQKMLWFAWTKVNAHRIGCRRKMRMSGLCKVEMSAFIDGRGPYGNGANHLEPTRTGPIESVARGEAEASFAGSSS